VLAAASLLGAVACGCESDTPTEPALEPICPNSSTAAPYHIERPAPGTIVSVGDSLEIVIRKNGTFDSPDLNINVLMPDGYLALPLLSTSIPMPDNLVRKKFYIAPSYCTDDFCKVETSPVTDSARIEVTAYNGSGGTTLYSLSECYFEIKSP
jgi:hypothetical protein